MFYPYLRGKRFESLALRAEAAALAAAGNIRPIVEPVKSEWRNLERALNDGLPLAVIVNPSVGDYSPPAPRARRAQTAMPAISMAVFAHAGTTPTMIITSATTAAAIRRFGREHRERRGFVVFSAPPANVNMDQEILALNPAFVAIRRRAVATFAARDINVDLIDNFVRADNNSLYAPDDFFTDRHRSVRTDQEYAHFADYSIQGDHYRDGGGRANNVALHHVYTIGPNPSDLRIRHYVSAAHRQVQLMWYDALSQLVADLPVLSRMSPLNDTAVLAEYRALHGGGAGAFPGLGRMKELAMRHHFQLMTVVQ